MERNVRWLFMIGGHRIRFSDDGQSAVGKLEKVYRSLLPGIYCCGTGKAIISCSYIKNFQIN